MMDDRRHEDMARLFSLLHRVDALADLKKVVGDYTKAMGTALVQCGDDPEKEKVMVEEMLALKLHVDGTLVESFENNEDLRSAVSVAFETCKCSSELCGCSLVWLSGWSSWSLWVV
jgi:hypothetical protein